MTPGLEPGIDLLFLPDSSLIISCNWKNREDIACSPDPLVSYPKALKYLLNVPGLLVATSLLPT